MYTVAHTMLSLQGMTVETEIAIDNTRRPTQKKLISAISNGIGTGLVESIDYPDNIKKQHPRKTPL